MKYPYTYLQITPRIPSMYKKVQTPFFSKTTHIYLPSPNKRPWALPKPTREKFPLSGPIVEHKLNNTLQLTCQLGFL
jgi:hypothetical protein